MIVFFFCNGCLAREVWVKAYQLEQTPENVWEVARYDVDCVEHAAVFFVSNLSSWENSLPPTPELMDIHSKHSVVFLLPHFEIYIERATKLKCCVKFLLMFCLLTCSKTSFK